MNSIFEDQQIAQFESKKPLDANSGEFTVKGYSEIIKNPNCNFTNEEEGSATYYFCLCSEEPYFPICKSCHENCHKNHKSKIEIEGYFTCMCGQKNNHSITEKENRKYDEKSTKIDSCFYSEFLEFCLYKRMNISNPSEKCCSICKDIGCETDECFDLDDNYIPNENNEVSINDIKVNSNIIGNNSKCDCKKHTVMNVVTFKNELKENFSTVRDNVLNFNFNIFFKTKTLKTNFIDFLNTKLEELKKSFDDNKNILENLNKKDNEIPISLNSLDNFKTSKNAKNFLHKGGKNGFNNGFSAIKNNLKAEGSQEYNHPPDSQTEKTKDEEEKEKEKLLLNKQIDFFTDYVNNNLFNVFFEYTEKYSSQYLHIKNFISPELKPDDHIKILSNSKSHRDNLENNNKHKIYLITKIHFASMIFNFYIKSHFLNFNNLLNFKTVLNLNIFQRYIYLTHSKNFYNLSDLDHTTIDGNLSNDILNERIPFNDFGKNIKNWEEFVIKFANSLLDTLELIGSLDTKKDKIYTILKETVEPICKIFKFLIKYNLIEKDLKKKFYEHIEVILKILILHLKKLNDDFNNFLMDNASEVQIYGLDLSQIKNKMKDKDFEIFNKYLGEFETIKDNISFVFQVVKSIFYYLLINNDEIIIKKLSGCGNKLEKNEFYKDNYSFQSSEVNEISKIFVSSIYLFTENTYNNNFQESKYQKKILKMDLYIKKILELLIGNSEFYIKSLDSLLHDYEEKVDNLLFKDFLILNGNHQKYIDCLKKDNSGDLKSITEKKIEILCNPDINNMPRSIKDDLNKKILKDFQLINYEFRLLNKNFYQYEIKFQDYVYGINKMVAELENLINKFSNDSYESNGNNFNKENYNNREINFDKKNNIEIMELPNIYKIKSNTNNNLVFEKNNQYKNNVNISISDQKNNINLSNNLKNEENLDLKGYSKIAKNEEEEEENLYSNLNNNKEFIEKNINVVSSNKIILDKEFHNEKDNTNTKKQINESDMGLKEEEFLNIEKGSFKNSIFINNRNSLNQVIGYTDFIENLNEFLDLYSNTSKFTEQIKELGINKNEIKFLLKFLLILMHDNNENISLLISLNPKKLFSTFEEFKMLLACFVEKISRIISEFDYFDNYYFITELINHLLNAIITDKKQSITNKELKIFSLILGAFKKIFFKYNGYNEEILNTFELIIEKINIIKDNTLMKENCEDFFNDMKFWREINLISKNQGKKEKKSENLGFNEAKEIEISQDFNEKVQGNNNDISINDDYNYKGLSTNKLINETENEKILVKRDKKQTSNENQNLVNNDSENIIEENNKQRTYDENYQINDQRRKELKIYEDFLKNYFSIINIAIEKDLNYYSNSQQWSSNLLIRHTDLKDKIKGINKFDISFLEEAEKFIHNLNLKSNLTFENLDSNFSEFQNSKGIERLSMQGSSKIFFSKSNLDNSYDLLKEQIDNFFYKTDFDTKKEEMNYSEKILVYLEYSIVNPLYKLLNLYLSQANTLLEEDKKKIHELIKIFHDKIIHSCYINTHNLKEGEVSILTKSESIIKVQYNYSDLKVKLHENDPLRLDKNLEKLKSLQYCQIKELINVFRVTLMIIKKNNIFTKIHLKKRGYKYKIFGNTYLDCYDVSIKDKIFEENYFKIITEAEEKLLGSIQKKYLKIINEYRKNLSECSRNQLSLIKCFINDEMDVTLNLRHVMIDYLLNKFFDKLTEANQKQLIPQNKYTLNKKYNELNNKFELEKPIDENQFKFAFKDFVFAEDLKLQNFYALFYLRNLFFYDSEKFQKSFLSLMEEQDVFEQIEENNEKKINTENFKNQLSKEYKTEKAKLIKNLKTLDDPDNLSAEMLQSLEKIKNYETIFQKYSIEENPNFLKKEIENEALIGDSAVKKIEYFLTLLNKYFIYGPIQLEINKISDINSERNLLNYNINYDFLISNIFFIQNICEGHDQNFQDLLFNMRLNPQNESKQISKIICNSIFKSSFALILKQTKENSLIYQEENDDTEEKKLAKEFLNEKIDLKNSYVNFNLSILRQILFSMTFDIEKSFLFSSKDFRYDMNLICVYTKLTDLLIEMIQGTKEVNLFYFLKPEINKKDHNNLANHFQEENKEYQFLSLMQTDREILSRNFYNTEKEIAIIKRCNFSILNNILKHEEISFFKIKKLLEIVDENLIMSSICYFMNKIVLNYHFEIPYEHEDFDKTTDKLEYNGLDHNTLNNNFENFKEENSVSKDVFFELCVEMYYYIHTMAKNFNVKKASDIIDIDLTTKKGENKSVDVKNNNKEIIDFANTIKNDRDKLRINYIEEKLTNFEKSATDINSSISAQENGNLNQNYRENPNENINTVVLSPMMIQKKRTNMLNKFNSSNYFNDLVSNNRNREMTHKNTEIQTFNNQNFNTKSDLNLLSNPRSDKNYPHNYSYINNFLKKIIKSIEFVVETDDNQFQTKVVYIIKQPEPYLVNHTKKLYFFSELSDRTDAVSKINSLLDGINEFKVELEYKKDNKKSKIKMLLIDLDYKYFDLVTLIFACAINFILLLGLDQDNFNNDKKPFNIQFTIFILGIVQIFINISALAIFIFSKYNLNFYCVKNNLIRQKYSRFAAEEFDKTLIISKFNLYDKLRVYFLDSILFADDIYFVIFNLILAIIGISDFYASFMFSLQLITVSRFLETLRDIIEAFKSRFDQLIITVFFLMIVIYFYTNVGFYFLNSEFNERGTGHDGNNPDKENTCTTLIRCFIYFFNEGVRSGGGIGDLLEVKNWANLNIFYLRWFLDMIYFVTIGLLLLNMINGVIVTTFSAIREESEKRDEDKENKCYICSIHKDEFEKRNVDFKNHKKKEHNIGDYINYILNLILKKDKELDSFELFIKKKIMERDTSVFPIYRSKSLGGGKIENEEDEN